MKMIKTMGKIDNTENGSSSLEVIDLNFFRNCVIRAIKIDIKMNKHGTIRYELFKELSGRVNCIDKGFFSSHSNGYSNQGFYEFNRIKTMLGNYNCDLVVLRNVDETKEYHQIDGLLTGYVKAGCELCYYEVTF